MPASDHAATSRPIPFEEIARFPLPGTAVPVQTAFSPSGRLLSYLYSPEGSLTRRLFVLRLGGGGTAVGAPGEVAVGGAPVDERRLSLEERLRRERAREVGVGVTAAIWAAEADVLLVPLPDGVHVVTGLDEGPSRAAVRRIVSAEEGPVLGPRLSPDGSKVAFVRDGDLYVAPTSGAGSPARLTRSAGEGVTNGLAEYVAQEEMDRSEGLWWSRDGALVAYAQVDERHVGPYRIVHQGSDEVGPRAEESHRYPFAGAANATVRLAVVPATGGVPVVMDTGDADGYLARVHWRRDGRLVAELESRDQRQLDVVAFDPTDGSSRLVHREVGEPYLNLHDDYHELESGEWLWSSERTGFRHLELRAADGSVVRTLTSGKWQVDCLEGVDETTGMVFFTATEAGATERQLYAVPLSGGPLRRVTGEPGTHVVSVSGRAGCYVDRFASLAEPPVVTVRSLETGAVLASLHDRRDPRIDELGLEPPELVTIEADDGTPLYGLFYGPDGAARPGGAEETSADSGAAEVAAPLVVSVYGGPHAQLVVDDWGPTVALRAQGLRRRGYAVLVVDNRGSARRGLAFEAAIRGRLGELEVLDQLCGVRWAARERGCDPARVAVYGWSYGGYMALKCLGRSGGAFAAAVAGAPVTAWDGYDTHYTERYMSTPASNPDGYASSSVFSDVEQMSGELMLVHGLIDENVHFRHTARLINRLVAARRSYRLLCFPDERHLPRRPEDRAFMEEEVFSFLAAALSASGR